MKKNKKIFIGIFIVISVLIILPFFISIRTYLNEAEKLASDKLGVPVTISSGRLLLLPSPRVVVSGVSVGEGDELKVEQIAVIPSLSTIFSTPRVVDVHITKPIVKKAALDIMLALAGKNPDASNEPNMVNIRRVNVDALQLDWPNLKLPVLNAEISFLHDQQLSAATLESIDGALTAKVTPEQEEYLISIRAEKWTLPVGLPLLIDKATLEARLKADRLEVPRIEMDLYGGKVNANLNVLWHKGWRSNGKVKVQGLAVKEPSRLISKAVYLSGQLSGNGVFSSVAKDAEKLMDNINAEFTFKVHDGVLHGLDLIKVASLLTKQTAGGETSFDDFSGLANAKGHQYHLNNLKLSSGLLSGSGQVVIAENKTLNGTAEVEVKRSVSLVAVPLDISGTVDNPVVLPSKAALAGAVAGTAILGPGLGTSVGIKAAGAIDKLKGLFKND